MVAHTFNSRTRKAEEQTGFHEFKVILVYVANFRPTKAAEKTLSQKTNKF